MFLRASAPATTTTIYWCPFDSRCHSFYLFVDSRRTPSQFRVTCPRIQHTVTSRGHPLAILITPSPLAHTVQHPHGHMATPDGAIPILELMRNPLVHP